MSYVENTLHADPTKTMLYGHSMGGGIAAKTHLETNHPGPLLSESSFSSFAAAVKQNKGRIVARVFKLLNWNVDALPAFANTKGKGVVVNRRDPIIPYEDASLYRALKHSDPHIEFQHVKIGVHPSKENLSADSIKSGLKKRVKKGLPSKARNKKIEGPKTDYESNVRELKKHKLDNLVPTPHSRIMDRALASAGHEYDTSMPALDTVNSKHAREDRLAYQAFLGLINDLWQQ